MFFTYQKQSVNCSVVEISCDLLAKMVKNFSSLVSEAFRFNISVHDSII